MDQEYAKRSGLGGGVARVINAGGSAVVTLYDAGSSAIAGLVSLVRKAPELPRKATGMFTGGLGIIRPGETKNIEARIRDYERKIQSLYYEIGKEGAKCREAEESLEAESVKKLIADAQEYEKEIGRLKDRIAQIEAEKKEDAVRRKKHEKEARKAEARDRSSYEQINRSIEAAVQKSVRYGVFDTASERAIFEKVARDLLDSEMEIKLLAAAELGKMGNEAAVPVLFEAAAFDEPSLLSEVINSLISIGDPRAIPLFKSKAGEAKYRVRIGCLRGLYKLAGDLEAMPFLIDALRDEHPEVRRSAATFIGWKDYSEAVPALLQCLRDDDQRVRKAAVSSLVNIKDETSILPLMKLLGDPDLEVREKALHAIRMIAAEDLAFDVHASGKILADRIEALKDWWQKERSGKVDFVEAEEPPAYCGEPEAPEALSPSEEVEAPESAGSMEGTEEVEESLIARLLEDEKDIFALTERFGEPTPFQAEPPGAERGTPEEHAKAREDQEQEMAGSLVYGTTAEAEGVEIPEAAPHREEAAGEKEAEEAAHAETDGAAEDGDVVEAVEESRKKKRTKG